MRPVHRDEVEEGRIDAGVLQLSVQDLGAAAGSVEVGLTRRRADPGSRPSPAHAEGGEEKNGVLISGPGLILRVGEALDHRDGEG